MHRYGSRFLPGPWFEFHTGGKLRWCQPDGILFDWRLGTLTLVEIKLSHTPDAYYQLKELYSPVVSRVFSPKLWSFRYCEIVKWYDPSRQFPAPCRLREEIEDCTPDVIGIHILGQRNINEYRRAIAG